jgi:ribosomal protein S18 acetylase RimI-like enzyme
MNNAIEIIQIDASKAQVLSDLAKKIYIPHYPYLWEEGVVDWYINEYAYPVFKIEAELKDPNNLHFIAFLNKEAIGYLKININTAAKSFDPITTLELERIYIDINCIQKGVGSQLMNFVKQLALKYNKKEIVLKAMDSAEKALQFYKKNGFEIKGSFRLPDAVFSLIKPEFRGMYILSCKL